VVGTVALSFDGEPWYDDIRDGEWMTNEDFLVIHRLAVSHDVRGTDLASGIMKQAEKLCTERGVRSIKIDTHEDNVIMQKFVKKNGFKYCGTVILGSEGKRLAFEKVL
jgi:GNAT superfamily N-acetyltransferase